jgi:alkylation response protein AidB-like acyl-CoA dehydrogenase
MTTPQNPWVDAIEKIGPQLQENGRIAEETDSFVANNYDLLRENKIFSALVPTDLGGGGASFVQMSEILKKIASFHPSTALSCSMHQHIISANVYNHAHGRPGKALLEKVAANELVLVSTGAGDWLASSGELTKVDGGYHYNGTKHFCSGSPGADLLITSGPYKDPDEGWQVLHYPVPIKSDGVTILGNWKAMGMRATGSNSVKLENVFIPEESVAARRPRGDYHAMWSVVLPVALPATPYLLGEMSNALTTAQLALDKMLSIAGDFDFEASLETVNEMVKLKTVCVDGTRLAVAKAVESASGGGFMRAGGLENLLRDVQASHFHPLQEKRQHLFTGHFVMGEEPPSQAF